ncbi:DUF6476 family protein [Paenirhodobacter sp. CAU 1674]|jgi:hypothetical protein|uniref:DUF6476 family protein n=1 Tax=Paenirhodobacter sp. CAU 1674 TaxID=3032596 RepID=UPI0023DA3F66|nr:DUF6476 family protein [Paenirhodobacter sp. CAU 1674]MDF2142192.1 DUF6476 family protein [Paenirhodobacter sp. CAU 1674]
MSDMMPSDPTPLPEIRFLKILVTALTATMIAGLVAIIALLVIRLPGKAALPDLPAAITLPAGARVQAITFARDYTVVVTEGGEVLLYRPDGTLARTVALQ